MRERAWIVGMTAALLVGACGGDSGSEVPSGGGNTRDADPSQGEDVGGDAASGEEAGRDSAAGPSDAGQGGLDAGASQTESRDADPGEGPAPGEDAGASAGASQDAGKDPLDGIKPDGPITFTSLYQDVFSQQQIGDGAGCGSFYCHAKGTVVAQQAGLHVGSKQEAYDLLVNAKASDNCNGWTRVVPGNPSKSLLVQKLVDPPCGERMPKGSDALPEGTVARIRAWILAGAKND